MSAIHLPSDQDRIPLRYQAVLFTVIRMIVNTSTRMVYPFLPAFGRGLGVELSTLSFILSGRGFMGAASPFLSPISDRYGRKIGMLLGLLLFTAGNAGMIFFPSLWAFAVALGLSMLGMFFFISSVQAYIGDRVSYARRGRMLAITELGWSLSFILGMPAVGFLLGRLGWQSPFYLFTGLGILVILAVMWLVPNRRPVLHFSQRGIWSGLGDVLRSPAALAGIAMSMTTTSSNELVSLVFGVWLESSFGLKLAALGMAAAVIGLSELVGELFTAWTVDHFGKERSMRTGLILNGLVALVMPWLGSFGLWGALLGLFLFYFSYEITILSMLPLMTEVLPSARAAMLSFNVAALSMGRGMGAFLAPLIFQFGFGASTLLTAGLDVVALLLLSRVKVGHSAPDQPGK